ncbi:MAG: hypothetical protein H0W72_14435, partial [Planctomycetes bacterium]|nr:hypothetical protein [Planctomycetota bacterium]
LPADVDDACGRLLAALLLPEDDPTTLAARWRAWPPHHADADPAWLDGDPRCLGELYRAAAQAAQAHLADEGGDPAAPYRRLGEALRRG